MVSTLATKITISKHSDLLLYPLLWQSKCYHCEGGEHRAKEDWKKNKNKSKTKQIEKLKKNTKNSTNKTSVSILWKRKWRKKSCERVFFWNLHTDDDDGKRR